MAIFNKYRVNLTKSTTNWDTRTKIKRAIWQLAIKPIFMLSPRPANSFRVFLLRLMGAKIGHCCLIEPKVNVLMPWNLALSAYVAIGREVNIYNYAPISIGSMTVISQFSFLCTGSHDYSHPFMPFIWAPINIGSECWVAADVFVAPGVTIGNGSVIGARSVVTKDIPEWMVCAGNPCKAMKKRVLREI